MESDCQMDKISIDKSTERICFAMNAGFDAIDITDLTILITRTGGTAYVRYPIHEKLKDGRMCFVLDDQMYKMKYGRYQAKAALGNCCCAEFEIDFSEKCKVTELSKNQENGCIAC